MLFMENEVANDWSRYQAREGEYVRDGVDVFVKGERGEEARWQKGASVGKRA